MGLFDWEPGNHKNASNDKKTGDNKENKTEENSHKKNDNTSPLGWEPGNHNHGTSDKDIESKKRVVYSVLAITFLFLLAYFLYVVLK